MYKFHLEKYRGKSSRHTCPGCNAPHEFTRYIDEKGNYLAETVGKCNRESKCGYHYKPKEFYRDNPELDAFSKVIKSDGINLKKSKKQLVAKYKQNKHVTEISKPPTEQLRTITNQFQQEAFDAPSVNYRKIAKVFQPKNNDSVFYGQPSANYRSIAQNFLPDTMVFESIGNYEQNAFIQFLLNLFPDDPKIILDAVKNYAIGTYEGKTVFWQIDHRGRVHTGKLILYNDQTGKRIAESFINRKGEEIEIKINWLHDRLKRLGKLNSDFALKQCYFGEHLVSENAGKEIAIVESEKTAVIASICIPEFIWFATGGKQNLKIEELQRFGNREITLFPDADGFVKWNDIARAAQFRGLSVKISTLIEDFANAEQKREGFDLADFLIEEQQKINRYNLYVDRYNSAVDKVLTDEILFAEFETILNEQKAIMVIDGGSGETEAESKITECENIRRIPLGMVC